MEKNKEISTEWSDRLPELWEGKKTMPQQVPANYFDKLPHTILAKVLDASSSGASKIVKLSFIHSWVKYAAAAVFIGVVLMSGYFYSNDQSIQPIKKPFYGNITGSLTGLSDQGLSFYLNSVTDMGGVENTLLGFEQAEPNDIILDQLSDELLIQYLSEQNLFIHKKSS